MQCTNIRWLFASAHFEPIKFHQKQQIDFERSTVPNADLYSIIALHFRFLSFSLFLSRSPSHFMPIRFDCDDNAMTRSARSANDSHPIMVSPTEFTVFSCTTHAHFPLNFVTETFFVPKTTCDTFRTKEFMLQRIADDMRLKCCNFSN